MAFIVAPGRNPVIAEAFRLLRVAEKKEAKAPKPAPSPQAEPKLAIPKGPKAKPGKRTPTKEERAWMDRITKLGCIACLIDGHPGTPGAVHHIVDANRRVGHLASICLCHPGHHMDGQQTGKVSRHPYKARFEKQYGTESELLARTKLELKKAKL